MGSSSSTPLIAAQNFAISAAIAARALPMRLRRLLHRAPMRAAAGRTDRRRGRRRGAAPAPSGQRRHGRMHGYVAAVHVLIVAAAISAPNDALTRERASRPPPASASSRDCVFSGKCGVIARWGLASTRGSSYVESRRGTEPQRARPLRCEAAPPTKEGPRAGPEKVPQAARVRVVFVLPRGLSAAGYDWQAATSPGTTGFDVVGSWGWWRVEVPGGLVKHPGKP